MKYKRTSIEVEAIQFKRGKQDDIRQFTQNRVISFYIPKCQTCQASCVVPTAEGDKIVKEGSFIEKREDGCLYVHTEEYFKENYRQVI